MSAVPLFHALSGSETKAVAASLALALPVATIVSFFVKVQSGSLALEELQGKKDGGSSSVQSNDKNLWDQIALHQRPQLASSSRRRVLHQPSRSDDN